MEMTRKQEMQAYTDALSAIATAVAWQVDPIRFFADIKALANGYMAAGHGPSAGLIDELARTVERRLFGTKGH